MSTQKKRTRLTEESVVRATGMGWAHWFKVLDKFGCKEKGHKESAKFLLEKHKLTPWWSQTVTVEYEVAKGLRKPGQRSDKKYALDVHRTVAASADACWAAWTTAKGLGGWFNSRVKVDLHVGGTYTGAGGDRCTYKSIVPNKKLRMTWENPKHTTGSVVEVTFQKLDKSKTRVSVSHAKIANRAEMLDLKKAWSGVMDEFRAYVER
jgi:uncharacterized protein YndB with AHSA1/START domain